MVITNKIKLYPTEEQQALLQSVIEKQTACANFFIDKVREEESTKLNVLHKYYYEARSEFELGADLTQLSMMRAIRAVRTAKSKRSNARYFKTKQVIFRILRADDNSIAIYIGDGFTRYIQYRGRKINGYIKKEFVIKSVGDEWYAYIPVEKETKVKQYKRVMGVDLGVAKVAVVADWNGRNTKFYRGEPLQNTKRHYRHVKASLQENKKQGNVYKKLKRISRKESNWVTDMNHKISRDIVNIAVRNKRTIALENLTGITERLNFNKKTRRMIKGWSFRQLADFIKYKAELAGITVVVIDPRETSRTCPKCRYCSRSNRRTQERFVCRKCCYESNADRVGAINIAIKGTELLASQ